MKKSLIALTALAILFSACSGDKKEEQQKIKLVFQPSKNNPVKINYEFSVNQLASGDVTTFNMVISGEGDKTADGKIETDMRVDSVRINGAVGGKTISGIAGSNDSLSSDVKLVAMPVFSFLGKRFKSNYEPRMDKNYETQISDSGFVDSTENKMQFLVRYPDNEVSVGNSWERNLVVKAGNKMNCVAKYTLKEIKGDSAIISIEGKLSGKGQSFGNDFTIDGKLNGSFIVDIKSGWPLNSEVNMSFTLNLNGKEVPMNYDIKNRVKL